ncbi:radical SAM protein [Chlorobium phaeobacteroides]|jgi:7-carboxy-7-deazaguanine synthase|uniref:7-carboxy-7-deazaguanine synthase n=1 Tax=Chlorobium phaeobacteroides (strain DSM 266 / SMG 266 / 2430) TaxID=290317 RepID=A1BHW5_CHLPD|nr:radical SAM protein [Chlorobium phaeobacteroides]ABL65992.1 Radical SAM domain protein [Chlorobium phaeobacteroides DSM 266]MBV5328569.1 radical SAM protein [Chlorobium sp.]
MILKELSISEIFHSIQGESSFAGWPCAFVRLAGCGNGCNFCDTTYAETDGFMLEIPDIIMQTQAFRAPIIEITGGEPLLQPAVYPLMQQLCNLGETVLLETGGFLSVDKVDSRVHKIIDLKPPSSGVCERNCPENITLALHAGKKLSQTFEFKIVVASREDYDWAKALLLQHQLYCSCIVMMGVIHEKLEPSTLAEWILRDRLPVRMQLQLHKYIWPLATRGT